MFSLSTNLYLKHKIGDLITDRYKIIDSVENSSIGPIYIVKDLTLDVNFICKEMAILKNREELLDRFKRMALKLQETRNSRIPQTHYVEDLKVYSVCPVCGETFIGEELSPCHMKTPFFIKKRCYLIIEYLEEDNLEEKTENKELKRWNLENCNKLETIYNKYIYNLENKKYFQNNLKEKINSIDLVHPTSSIILLQKAEKVAIEDVNRDSHQCPYNQEVKFNWNIKKSCEKEDNIEVSLYGAPECFEKGQIKEVIYKIDKSGNILSKKNIQDLEPNCTNCPYISREKNEDNNNTMPRPGIESPPPYTSSETVTLRSTNLENYIEGIVISVDPLYEEPPDRDFAKLGVGLFAALALTPFFLIAFSGCIVLSFVLRVVRLNRLISPLNPLGIFGLLAFFGIGRRAIEERIPVRNFRIRDREGNEYQVRMKGHLQLGSVAPADRLSIWGKWKKGTLIFKRAYNHRTQSEIRVRQHSVWPKIVLGIIGLSIVISLFLYYGGKL